MVELVVFLVLAAVVIGIGALIVWIAGVPLGLTFTRSIVLAAVSLVFLLPAFFHMRTAVRNTERQPMSVRLFTGFMAFGMILFGLPVVVAALSKEPSPYLLWFCGAGAVLTFVGMSVSNFLER
jgi:hypothetical protein